MKYFALYVFLFVGDHDETFIFDRLATAADCSAAVESEMESIIAAAGELATAIETMTGQTVGPELDVRCIPEAAI